MRPCTATMPAASPSSRCFHGAGNARIAATSTIVASTPLQPASIDTAKPLAVLCSTLPVATTFGIEQRDEPRADRRQRVGPRDDEVLLRPRRQLGAEQHGLQDQELDEEADHGRRFYGSSAQRRAARRGPRRGRRRVNIRAGPRAPDAPTVSRRRPRAASRLRTRHAVQQLRLPDLVPARNPRRLLPARRRRPLAAQAWLTLASLFFYGWWNPWHLPLILGSIALQLRGRAARCRRGAVARAARVAASPRISRLLGVFKYADFFLANVARAAPASRRRSSHLALPLGISFFTFTQIAYLVDVYRRKAQEPVLANYALFVTFFPHLLAGPDPAPQRDDAAVRGHVEQAAAMGQPRARACSCSRSGSSRRC